MTNGASAARRRFNEAKRTFNKAVVAYQTALNTHAATRVDLDRVLNVARHLLDLQHQVLNNESTP